VINDKEGEQQTDKEKGVSIDEVDYEEDSDDEDSDDSALGIHFDDSEDDCMLEDNFENEGGDAVVDQTVVDENVVDETVTKDRVRKSQKKVVLAKQQARREDQNRRLRTPI